MHECGGKFCEELAVELLYPNLPRFFCSAVHDSGTVESTIRAECAAVKNLVPLLARAYRCLFVYTLRLQLREWQERLKQSWSSFTASSLRSQNFYRRKYAMRATDRWLSDPAFFLSIIFCM